MCWAIAHFFQTLLFSDPTHENISVFKHEEFSLPPVDSLEWINGFEWKGLYIRIIPESESDYLQAEIKALKILYLEYIQLIEGYESTKIMSNYLSNELIFPLLSYVKMYGIVLYVSLCIPPIFAEENLLSNSMHLDFALNTEENLIDSNRHGAKSTKKKVEIEPRNLESFFSHQSFILKNYDEEKEKWPQIEFSVLDDLESKTQINFPSSNEIDNFLKDDLKNSALFSTISRNSVVKISDDSIVSEDNKLRLRIKYLIINPQELLPDLIGLNSSSIEFLIPENDFRPLEFFNGPDQTELEHILNRLYTPEENEIYSYLEQRIREFSDSKDKGFIDKLTSFLFSDCQTNSVNSISTFESSKTFSLFENLQYKLCYSNASNNTDSKFFAGKYNKFNSRANEIVYFCHRNLPQTNFQLFDLIKKSSFYSRLSKLNNLLDLKSNFKGAVMSKGSAMAFNIINPGSTQENLNTNAYTNTPLISVVKDSEVIKNQANYSHSVSNQAASNWYINNSPLSEIRGPVVMKCQLRLPIKFGYSLVPSIRQTSENDRALKLNYNKHLEKFIAVLNTMTSLNSIEALNNLFERYSIPLELKYFLIPRIKLSKIADILKVDFLVDLIRKTVLFQEGINFVNKVFFINLNNHVKPYDVAMKENLNVINDGFFAFIKEKNLFNIFKEKFYQTIMSIFSIHKAQPSFVSFFFESLNFTYFSRILNLRIVSEFFTGRPACKNNPEAVHLVYEELLSKEYVEIFIKNCILTANERPFLFLSALEKSFNVLIDPYIKFKSSISKDQFVESFSVQSILEREISVESYLEVKDMVEYIYVDLAPQEEDFEDDFPDDDITEGINVMGPKINKKGEKSKNPLKSIKAKMASRNGARLATNSSILKSYSDNSLNDVQADKNAIELTDGNKNGNNTIITKNIKDNHKLSSKQALIRKLTNSLDLTFSSCLYKLKTLEDLSITEGEHMVNKHFSQLKFRYSVKGIKDLKDWRNRIDYLLYDVHSVAGIELNFIPTLKVLFLYTFFIEQDASKAKDFFKSIKEFMKSSNLFCFEDLIMKNVLEGLLTERTSFIDSEYYYSNSLALLLLSLGDPRGRGSYGDSNFLLPLWKVARHCTVLEQNPEHNEYIKELFHCQDNTIKTLLDLSTQIHKILKGDIRDSILNQAHKDASKQTLPSEHLYSNSYFNILYDSFLVFESNTQFQHNFLLSHTELALRKKNLNTPERHTASNVHIVTQSEIKIKNEVDAKLVERLSYQKSLKQDKEENYETENDNNIEEYGTEENMKRIKKLEFLVQNDIINTEGVNFNNSCAQKNVADSLLDENYCFEALVNFHFPSISNLKHTQYINSNEFAYGFINWIMRQNDSKTYIVEEFLTSKLEIQLQKVSDNAIHPTSSSFRSNLSNNASAIQQNSNIFDNLRETSYIIKKESNAKKDIKLSKTTLSAVLHDIVLTKLSFKTCLPKGFLMTFGGNSYSQTGHSNYEYIYYPRLCFKIKEETVDKAVCGWEHNLVLTRSKSVYSWGNNNFGQCGVGITGSNKSGVASAILNNPTKISTLSNIVSITAGNEFSLALDSLGNVYSWGKAEGGLLGYNLNAYQQHNISTSNDQEHQLNNLYVNKDNSRSNNNFLSINQPVNKEFSTVPRQIHSLKNIKFIFSGSLNSVAIDNKHKVFSWGCGEGGQLGFSENVLLQQSESACITNPLSVTVLENLKIIKVSCGEAHSVSCTSTGEVFGWGFNSSGQLGLGTCADSFEPGTGVMNSRIFTPKKLEFVTLKKKEKKIVDKEFTINPEDQPQIIDVVCGKTFTMFIDKQGTLYGCGSNDFGQLGMKRENVFKSHLHSEEDEGYCFDIVYPIRIENLTSMKVNKIACGESHCIAIVNDLANSITSIWSWGSNKSGQLGHGNASDLQAPRPISYLLSYERCRIVDVACGAYHSVCILSNYTSSKSNNINVR